MWAFTHVGLILVWCCSASVMVSGQCLTAKSLGRTEGSMVYPQDVYLANNRDQMGLSSWRVQLPYSRDPTPSYTQTSTTVFCEHHQTRWCHQNTNTCGVLDKFFLEGNPNNHNEPRFFVGCDEARQTSYVQLKVPVRGITTPGSLHTRIEFRELKPSYTSKIVKGVLTCDAGNPAVPLNRNIPVSNWNAGDSNTHILQVGGRIIYAPKHSQQIAFAQVFNDGYPDKTVKAGVVIELLYDGALGNVQVIHFPKYAGAASTTPNVYYTIGNYKLGDYFDLTLTVTKGSLKVNFNDLPAVTVPNLGSKIEYMYFKAGNYHQSCSGDVTGTTVVCSATTKDKTKHNADWLAGEYAEVWHYYAKAFHLSAESAVPLASNMSQ